MIYQLDYEIDSIEIEGDNFKKIVSHENAIHLPENSFLPIFQLELDNVSISNFTIENIRYIPLTSSERNTVQNDTITKYKIPFSSEESLDDRTSTKINIPTIEYDSVNNRFRKISSFQLNYEIRFRFNTNDNASVLSEGRWFKIGVVNKDIYKIDFNFLSSLGIDVSNIDPATIQIYGNGGKMLPQKNAAKRPQDLIENAVIVFGEQDGSFDANDYILFYGQSSDSVRYDEVNAQFIHQNNLYSDTTFYFLTFGKRTGKRIQNNENLTGTYPVIDSYVDFDYYENDFTTILAPGSGREWYGVRLTRNSSNRTIDFVKPGIISGSQLNITSKIVGQTFATAEMRLSVNSVEIGSQTIDPIPDSRFAIKGTENTTSFSANSSQLNIQNGLLRLSYDFLANSSASTSTAHVNYVTVESNRRIAYYNQTSFFQFRSGEYNGVYTLNVNGNDNLQIWNIANALNPLKQNFTAQSNQLQFSTDLTINKEFVVFDSDNLAAPIFDKEVANQNIAQLNPAKLLIITSRSLEPEASRYANFKEGRGINTNVVTVDKIYNEFSSGSQDVTAIRDFIRSQFEKSTGDEGLKSVLLFGKGSYDYKDRISGNTNIVPIYESRNSLDPIDSYSSDDYFGFMDPSEGEWIENSNGDHLLDLGVGRIPVANIQEARGVVDKLIRYKTDSDRFGKWTNDVVFVADDEDGNLHQGDAEELWQMIDTSHSEFIAQKIYMDAFQQEVTPVERSPEMTERLLEVIDEGALMINFTGHGGETGWTDEQIFQNSDIISLNNLRRLPLFVTATCEFGRNDDPLRVSGGELLVTNENGGAVALITTARPVFSNSNFELNKALYSTVFEQDNQGRYPTLGEIIKETKNNSLRGPNNRNFSLLGDPSMTLNYPEYRVQGLELKNQRALNNIDTINALSRITIEGQVVNSSNTVMESFNGIVNIRMFDKLNEFETLGSKATSPPFNFQLRDNILFNGQASVVNGEFSSELIVPVNIDYSFGEGLIHFYAESAEQDANGVFNEIIIGGSDENILADNNAPEIQVFLNDTTFKSGDVVDPSPLMMVRLSDESGINISNEGFSNSIDFVLDSNDPVRLNNYFISDLDDFTKGWVFFELDNLERGEHTLNISASDNFGNRSSKEIDFVVGKPSGIRISDLKVYPNPVKIDQDISFSITQNRLDENASFTLDIMSIDGQLIYSLNETFFISNISQIIKVDWQQITGGSSDLNQGIYIYRLSVISEEDGSSDVRAGRLILDN
ncbi:MAG: type IX secretion system sortase PorU [Bacteroidota bacterium]